MASVAFFLCDNMLATSLTLPLEQLRAAEQMAMAAGRRTDGGLKILLVSLEGTPVRTHTGLTLTPDCGLEEADDLQLIYLPALWRNPRPILQANRDLLPWLVQQHEKGATLAGVGTGCCFMAEAGLLDHRPGTTHWYYFDNFAKSYPLVDLKRHHFITRSDNLFCAASVNSLADVTIYFIQQLFGGPIAQGVERHFFHEIRQAYASSLHEQGGFQFHPDEAIAQAQAWMTDHAHQNLPVKQMAATLQMSVRTFNRRFRGATGQTPLEYLQSVRIRNARELLQTTNLSITEVAFNVGYQDMAHFNELFRKHLGTTPKQYRATVRKKLFTASFQKPVD